MICTIKPVYALQPAAQYLCIGLGKKAQGHIRSGTDRLMPGSYISAPTMESFVEAGERITARRRVKAQSVVVSFSPEELDKTDPDDQRTVGALAFKVVSRAFPGAMFAIVVHADGGAPHAHALVINDLGGRPIRDNRAHWQLKRIADEVALESGFSVIARPPSRAAEASWFLRRETSKPFDQGLGDAITAALQDERCTSWSDFTAACEERGVTVTMREEVLRHGPNAGDRTVGITYRMLDSTGDGKPRIRRRKASALSSDFTHAAIEQILSRRAFAIAESISTASEHSAAKSLTPRLYKSSAPHLGELTGILERTLAAGVFASLDGWALVLAKAGVQVIRARRRERLALNYRYRELTVPEEELSTDFHATSISSLSLGASATAALVSERDTGRQVADHLEQLEALAPRRRRALPLPPLPPAREREIQRDFDLR